MTAGHLGAVSVRPVDRNDRDDWLRMRIDLWPEGARVSMALKSMPSARAL